MPKLLTDAAVEKLRPDPDKRREVRDAGARGLYLVIQPTGAKSWVLRGRRPDGRHGKTTLGPWDVSANETDEPVRGAPLSLSAARVLANQLLREKARGVDVAAPSADPDVFLTVATDFIADHARPKNRGWRTTARTLGLHYPDDGSKPELVPGGLAQRWASTSIAEIDAAAIHAIVDEARRRGIPGQTPRTVGVSDPRGRLMAGALGKLFSWAVQHRKVAVNPSLGMYRPKSPELRDRVLADGEVRALWQACGKLGRPFGAVFKLLLLTGQRRSEVAGMKWAELNDDFSIWSLPPARTKNKLPHIVFLPPAAREIIAAVPRIAGAEHVFSTTGNSAISGFSKLKARLDGLMETTEPWRLHDARRTAVTGMAELGVQPHIIEAVVNHISGHKGGVAGIYNKAAYAAEKKGALELWAKHVVAPVKAKR